MNNIDQRFHSYMDAGKYEKAKSLALAYDRDDLFQMALEEEQDGNDESTSLSPFAIAFIILLTATCFAIAWSVL